MTTRRRRDGGAALVEFALILPLIALLVFGTIDIARAYRLSVRLEAAAREGAAFSQIYPNRVVCPPATTDVRDRVDREDPDLSSHAGYDVKAYYYNTTTMAFVQNTDCESSDPASSGDRIRVEVEGDFDVITPLLNVIVGDPISMTGTAEVVAQG